MKHLIRTLFSLAAPAIALPDDDPDMVIGQARERVCAVPEGAELVDFLDQSNYEISFFKPEDERLKQAQDDAVAAKAKHAFMRSLAHDKAHEPESALHAKGATFQVFSVQTVIDSRTVGDCQDRR